MDSSAMKSTGVVHWVFNLTIYGSQLLSRLRVHKALLWFTCTDLVYISKEIECCSWTLCSYILAHHWCLVKARKGAAAGVLAISRLLLTTDNYITLHTCMHYSALLHLTCVVFLLGVISSHVFNGPGEARTRHGDCSRRTQCSCSCPLLCADVGMVSQGGKDCHRLPDSHQVSVVHMWQRGQCFLCCDFGCLHLVAHLLQSTSMSSRQTYPFLLAEFQGVL